MYNNADISVIVINYSNSKLNSEKSLSGQVETRVWGLECNSWNLVNWVIQQDSPSL